ncbi:DUF3866 family protein [Longirhabdus pacifica]|uniref:DUF3866 family protein n=1 Tax=Longirhabdus pacifica TaxID=2305227 RepID=UPI0010087FD4|nr:DUF3866 family protein [Longirhabdus pacifica]
MLHMEYGKVTGIIAEREGLQTVEVTMKSGVHTALHYSDTFGKLKIDDDVVLNTTAEKLKLGSGGHHFVMHVVKDVQIHKKEDRNEKEECDAPLLQKHLGHIMKMRYTPYQQSVLTAEEQDSPYHAMLKEKTDLNRMPVLIGELHSMLPIACCWLKKQESKTSRNVKIAYIMSDGGALPLSLSDHVATLKQLGYVNHTITYGHAYGGDMETVNKFTALMAAKVICKADIIICCMGPGCVGTGTKYGYSGIETGELVNAVSILGGTPIVIPRMSFADGRSRHYGISHHVLHSMSEIALRKAVIPMPNIQNQEKAQYVRQQLSDHALMPLHHIKWMEVAGNELLQAIEHYPKTLTSMGRTYQDDPIFFAAVAAAAQYGLDLILGKA